MLSDAGEAAVELSKIPPEFRAHPEYLDTKCKLLIAQGNWVRALSIGERQVIIAPQEPSGWINRSYCLHELRRTTEAMALLQPAARRFPKYDIIPFNLACYCCHLKRFSEALDWINRTIDLCGPEAPIDFPKRLLSM